MEELNIDLLVEETPALSKNVGNYLSEAAVYCLNKNHHRAGTVLEVSGITFKKFAVRWTEAVDKSVERSWGDSKEAVEYGATALAFLILRKLTNYTIIERSFQGTGFDYWLSTTPFDENQPPFHQRKAKLEVSGILTEKPGNSIERRLREKIKQIEMSDSSLPAIIVVVEFGVPKAKLIEQ
jgi:hypothetical protein